MAVLSGEVKIAMSITGTGDGVAKTKAAEKAVADLEKKVGETTRSTKAASTATSGWASSLESIKGSVKPLDGVRGVFENLRSNLLGFPMALAGLASGLATVIVKFAESGTAAEALRVNAERYAEAIAGARKDLEELAKRQGDALPDPNDPIGADAGARFADVTEKVIHLNEELRRLKGIDAIGQQLAPLNSMVLVLGDVDARYLAIKKVENEIAELDRMRLDLQTRTANEVARQADETARLAKEQNALAWGQRLSRSAGIPAADLFASFAAAKGTSDPERVRDYNAIFAAQDAMRRGGGSRDYDPFEGKSQFMSDGPRKSGGISRSEFKQLERLIGEVTGRDDGPGGTDKGGKRRNAEARGGIARDIRDFSSALSDALPGMSEFTTALSKIVELWTKWGQSSISTEAAVVGSLGAIAQAGAMAIKDERARAGVLSIIQLGLGLGKVFIPGLQAEAAGHFAAAATLGSVAIFGSGSGGGRGAGGGGRGAAPTRGSVQSSGEMLGANNVSVTIHGNYYGGRREQEAASDFARLTRRRGNGFADEGRRSANG